MLNPASGPSGFSLVEILVALMLLAIGLLGLARLQTLAFRNLDTAGYRYQVGEAMAELGERLRANPLGAACLLNAAGECGGSASETPYTRSLNQLADQTVAQLRAAAPASLCTDSTAACTPAQVAAVDAYQWMLRVKQTLPEMGGRADLAKDAAGLPVQPLTYRMLVLWREPGFSPDGASAAEANDPNCAQQNAWSAEQLVYWSTFRAASALQGAGLRCLMLMLTP